MFIIDYKAPALLHALYHTFRNCHPCVHARGRGRGMLGNNLYALIPIVVISGEDTPTTRSTGAAQRKQNHRIY